VSYSWKNIVVTYSIVIHFSRAVRDVLNNTYHDPWIGRGGPTAWPPRSPDLNPLDCYLWGHLNTPVYAAPVDNEEALHHRIVDACQTIRNCPGIFGRMPRSMSRRVLNLMEAILSTYKCTPLAITHKLNVSGHMLIWAYFFFSCFGMSNVSKACPHLSVTSCISLTDIKCGITQLSMPLVAYLFTAD
jgi:hypothetical protein